MRGSRLDFFPQLIDEYAQVFRFIAIVGAPDGLQKPSMLDGLALIHYQMTQQFKFLGREPNWAALRGKFSSLEIDFQVACNIRRDCLSRGCPPQGRANTR